MRKRVAILYGGKSAEREVSITSSKGVIEACDALGYEAIPIDAGKEVAAKLAEAKPDVAFNALHGRWGEDGCMQGLLEMMEIPYTHSGVKASAVAMDKLLSKRLFEMVEIPCAEDRRCSVEEMVSGKDPMPRPYVVKPINEGSSVGVHIVLENDNFFFTKANWPYGDVVMVEHYIEGREITVAVLDDVALGVTELKPLSGFYDYENKYTDGKTQHLCPAPITEEQAALVKDYALKAHQVLGCRGLSRSDFRLAEDGTFYILETNTQPGLTPLSLAPEIAAHAGIDFKELVRRLVEGARLGD